MTAVQAPTTPAGIDPYLRRSLTISRGYEAALRRLSPPASLAATHRHIVVVVGQENDLLASVAKKIEGGADPAASFKAMIQPLLKLGRAEDAGWRQAGVRGCLG